MDLEAAGFRDIGDGADLVERINRAEIARLGQVDRGGLAAMQLPRLDRGEGAGEGVGIDASMIAGDGRQLHAAAEKPGGIGFRCVDVRRLAAINETPGGARRGQGQRIGGGAGGDRKDANLGLEQLAEALL